MSRRYQEIEEEAKRDLDAVKGALQALRDPQRALIVAWLLVYYEDSGAMRSPQAGKPRRRVTLDGVEYWIFPIPKRRAREGR